MVHLDDIFIFLHSPRDHTGHVQRVLSHLWDVGAPVKLKKSNFFTGTIGYLGRLIRPRHLGIATHTTDAIKGFKQPPTNIIKLCSFLGLWIAFRRFVSIFVRIAALLNYKVKNDQLTLLGALLANELKTMHELQNKQVSPSILALSCAVGRYNLDTEASNVHVGCVLLQEQPDGSTKPLGYCSRSLTTDEQLATRHNANASR